MKCCMNLRARFEILFFPFNFCQVNKQRRQQNQVGNRSRHQRKRGKPAQRLRAAKRAEAENNKARGKHNSRVDNAEPGGVNGLYHIALYRNIFIHFLLVVDQEANGNINGNTQRHAENKNC